MLLLYPPGLEYVCALFGCLYAGAVAVPAYPLRKERGAHYLSRLLADAGTSTILTAGSLRGIMGKTLEGVPGISWWLVTDVQEELQEAVQEADARAFRPVPLSGDDLAYLQYTSGSTQDPRGVEIRHRNLIHNLDLIHEAFETSEESSGVSWLPPYHDLGLVGGILQPLHSGFPCVMLSPTHFIRRPMAWLRLISDRRLTITGAPDFAYALCAETARPEDLETLDLSSWTLALDGSEPVRPETMERFARVFEPCGFRAETLYPGYGLAEATLMVTGGSARKAPPIARFDAASLDLGEARRAEPSEDAKSVSEDDSPVRTLVGCGRARADLELRIVDPETRQPLAEGRVGEIWLAGDSVASGYWNRPELTAETFRAYTADPSAGPYLRTGDLGFLQGGELFVAGRSKDLIILRGRNLYPQDIEFLAHRAHPALPAGRGAAFTLDVAGREELVLVHEVARARREDLDPARILAAVDRDLAAHHAIRLYALFLLRPGAIPRTPNGKIQRQACRARLLAEELDVLAFRVRNEGAEPGSTAAGRPPQGEMESLVAEVWKEVLGREEIDVGQSFFDLGGDSATAVQVQERLERKLGRSLPVVDLFRLATVEALAAHLQEQAPDSPPAFADTGRRVAQRRQALAARQAQRRRTGR